MGKSTHNDVKHLKDIVEKQFNLNWSKFKSFLAKHKGAIAGSTVMKAILDSEGHGKRGDWKDMDLDLWFDTSSLSLKKDDKVKRKAYQYKVVDDFFRSMDKTEFSTFPRAFGRNENISESHDQESGSNSNFNKDKVESGAVTVNGQEYTRLMGYVDGMWQVKIKDGIVIQFIFLQSDVSIPETVATFDLLATHVYFDAALNQILSPPEKVKVKLLTVWTHENKDTGQNDEKAIIPKARDIRSVKWVKLETRSAEARNDLIRGFSEFSPVAAILQSPYEWMRTMRRSVKYARRGIFINPNDKYTWAIVTAGLRRNATQMRYAFDWTTYKYDWNEMVASMPLWMIPILENLPTEGTEFVNGKLVSVPKVEINEAFTFRNIQCVEVNKIREHIAKDPFNIVIFDRKCTKPELYNVVTMAKTFIKNIISNSTLRDSPIPVKVVTLCQELDVILDPSNASLPLEAFQDKLLHIAKETTGLIIIKTHGNRKDGYQMFKDIITLLKKKLMIYEVQDDDLRIGRIDPLQREVFRLLCPVANGGSVVVAKGGKKRTII